MHSCREDEKQAAAAGLMKRPLTQPSVEKVPKIFDPHLPPRITKYAAVNGGQNPRNKLGLKVLDRGELGVKVCFSMRLNF